MVCSSRLYLAALVVLASTSTPLGLPFAQAQEGGDSWVQPGDFREPGAADRAYAEEVAKRLEASEWGGLKSILAPQRPDPDPQAEPHPAYRGVYFHLRIGSRTLTVSRQRTKTDAEASALAEATFRGCGSAPANSTMILERRGCDLVLLLVLEGSNSEPTDVPTLERYLLAAWRGEAPPKNDQNLSLSRYGGSAGDEFGPRETYAAFTQTGAEPCRANCHFLHASRQRARLKQLAPGPAREDLEQQIATSVWARMELTSERLVEPGRNELWFKLKHLTTWIRVLGAGVVTAAGSSEAKVEAAKTCLLQLVKDRGISVELATKPLGIPW